MLVNENIICISSIDWDFIWQGHQEIMSALAKNKNRVLFIENTGARMPNLKDAQRIRSRIKNWLRGIKGIREERENLYIFSPLVLPFPYSRIARWINMRLVCRILDKWVKAMNFSNPITWAFLPTPLSLDIIDNLNSKATIYYCIDNFRASSNSAKKIKKSEINLLKKADLVFVTSRELRDYCSTYNKKVYNFPFAVNFQEFQKARQDRGYAIPELEDLKRPIIGYVGGVHKWVDLGLIKKAAQEFPGYSFVFIGPIQTEISSLAEFKNIYFLGKRDHREIPYFIDNFDVCIIPYLVSEYTNNVYPTKLNEYHALGKAIVSTNLPEVESFNKENDNLVFIGKSPEEFIKYILAAADNPGDTLAKKRISAAERNSWDTRIEEMGNLIDGVIKEKSLIPFDWKRDFLRLLYRKAHRKIIKLAFASLGFYFLIFYTPLVWFLARPLKIANEPKKADCIVVFGGGVGESGKAGQGYAERVKYAVELYRQGLARYVIFSSGYKFIFEEPQVMKALAVSLGIPENSIVTEEEAINTYQNVKFTSEILNKNGWHSILLVSPPYHMRRASLVFNKAAKEINITYIPIKDNAFYAHPENMRGRLICRFITLKQIKGILHEYLSILYYSYKGYI